MGTSTVIALGVVAAIAAAVIAVALNKRSRRNKEKDMPAGLQVFDGNGKLEVDVTSVFCFIPKVVRLNREEVFTYTLSPSEALGRTLVCFCANSPGNSSWPQSKKTVERLSPLSVRVTATSDGSVFVFLLV